MQGTDQSAVFCPIILGYLVALIVITLAYAVIDGLLRSRSEGGHGLGRALRHVRPTVIVWELPFVAALVFLYIWCARGLYSGEEGPLVTYLRWIDVAGVVVLPRLRVADFLAQRLRGGGAQTAPIAHTAVTIVLMAACVNLARLALEVPWNEVYQDIELQFVAIEATIILLAFLGLYFVCQRRGAGVAVGVMAMLVLGIAQYFVFLFKDANITPADLQALGTAAEVAGTYVYTINEAVVHAIALACAGVAAAAYLMPPAPRAEAASETAAEVAAEGAAGHDAGGTEADAPTEAGTSKARALLAKPVTRRTALGLASWGGLALFVTVPGYGADFGVSLNHWNSMYSTSRQGFFPCFVKEFQARLIPVPRDYSDDGAKAAEKRLVATYDKTLGEDAPTDEGTARKAAVAQFKEEQPSVVVIMNESFSDLSVYQAISAAGYEGPTFVKTGLTDSLARGNSYTSIFGGGTCNSEFEALCGVNLHYLGSNKYPYTQWDFNKIACMPRQFAKLGYQTTAIHPNEGTNWDRNRVYKQMDFDTFYTIDDFEGAETYHNGYVSDKATYQKVLDVLKSSDRPQFVHDVTMQNHGPFTTGTIPMEDRTYFAPEGATTFDNSKLNEYLACANKSDEAIKWFVGELRNLDRPVVVLFFGDHQPKPASPYATLGYEGEPSIVTAERMYHTTYFMWANYDVAGNDQVSEEKDEPVSALGDVLMQRIGAPLNDRQKANLASQADLPILSLIGYQDAGGTWHAYNDDEEVPSPEEAKGSDAATQADALMAYVNYLEFGSIVN